MYFLHIFQFYGRSVSDFGTAITFSQGGFYYIYNDSRNQPVIQELTGQGFVQWRSQDIPQSTIIRGIQASLELDSGWKTSIIQTAPEMQTLEYRIATLSSNSDKEATSILRHISRAGNMNTGTWYVFTHDKRPGETFYAHSKPSMVNSFWEVYRKL